SGTTFSACTSAGLPSVSTTRSAGTFGSAVVVHAAVTSPALTAAKSFAPSANSRAAGNRQPPTAEGVGAPAIDPTTSPWQCCGRARGSLPPHFFDGASATASAGLSSAAVV